MSNGFPFIDIIFFACVALFIAFRLRSVLGRRTGHERQPDRQQPANSPYTAPDADNVVSLPDREGDAEAAFEHVEEGQLRDGLTAIRRADPHFDLEQFLGGARMAFEMIVDAFARGDKDALRPLLADEVFAGFAQAIDDREAAGETLETTVDQVKIAEAVDASMQGTFAHVTVRFVSDQINVTRGSDGDVVDGDPTQRAEIVDLWTFRRDTAIDDPNWELASTSAGDS